MYFAPVLNKVTNNLRVTVLFTHQGQFLFTFGTSQVHALSWSHVRCLMRAYFTPQLQALPVLSTLVNSPLPRSTCPGVSPSSRMASWRDTAWSTSPARLWMVRNYTTLKALAEQIIEGASSQQLIYTLLGLSCFFKLTNVWNLLSKCVQDEVPFWRVMNGIPLWSFPVIE